MKMKTVPVVLAGGVGERFWPLSRQSRPKQLLPIVSKKSMIEETLARTRPFCTSGVKPLIVTSKAIASSMRRMLPKSVKYDSIVEPVGKNTAPAIAAAAALIRKKHGDALMLVLPADHAVSPAREFVSAVRFAARAASETDALCVFGIRPVRAETGYGYIQAGERLDAQANLARYDVRRFVEKPSASLAQSYVGSGEYFWNSGMFVWKASVILEEIAAHMPELHRRVEALQRAKLSTAGLRAFYQTCRKESVDYGILEKSNRVTMVCPSFSWDDVGSWESLARIHGENTRRNTVVGGRVFDDESTGSILVNESDLTLAACGVRDMVVVATGDAVLVVPRDKLPSIRQYLAAMKNDRSLPRSIF
ncbi:MAG: NTP transferase domain-containing protein [Chitinivibrionales bacterium]|nr:NTP transferase domain-containing protein [Chitinivibrionales bacterium]MBD3394454.1 NTP transferase domain-containing protein [Chitinivibrionales bacterium]